MLLGTAKPFKFLTWRSLSPSWNKRVHKTICDKLLLQQEDLCSLLSDLLFILLISLNDEIILQAYRHAMESFYNSRIFISISISVIKYNRAFPEETVHLAIKFTTCRTKFLLFRAAQCLALIYLYSGVYNPQTDHNIYHAPELDREEACCFNEEDLHGV